MRREFTRVQLSDGAPKAYEALVAMSRAAGAAASAAGLDPLLVELVKIRASQLNGCAFCLDMHSAEAVENGEDPRRLFVLDAWRETDLYSEQERAALALTESMTLLAETRDVPDEVYDRALAVFTEEQYKAVAWLVIVINGLNRVGVTSRMPLP